MGNVSKPSYFLNVFTVSVYVIIDDGRLQFIEAYARKIISLELRILWHNRMKTQVRREQWRRVANVVVVVLFFMQNESADLLDRFRIILSHF